MVIMGKINPTRPPTRLPLGRCIEDPIEESRVIRFNWGRWGGPPLGGGPWSVLLCESGRVAYERYPDSSISWQVLGRFQQLESLH